jgi:imidazolonepropionase-like amidohydrolase
MRKLVSIFTVALCTCLYTFGQNDTATIWFVGADIYTAENENFSNGALGIKQGKIVYVGTEAGEKIDVKGKKIYPGLIALNSNLGLTEIEAVRATHDFREVGQNNAHIRSAIAFNTDSRVMKTVLANGILMAQVVPQGGLISGQSSVMKLQARNWEEALYVADNAIHIHWPNFDGNAKQTKRAAAQKQKIVSWLQQAQSYIYTPTKEKNLRFEALKGAINGSKKVFVHTNRAQSIISAVLTLKKFNITPTIVGGSESGTILSFLKKHKVGVIISRTQRLPKHVDDTYEEPYALVAKLWKDSIPFAISDINFWEQRNLPFQAGQAVAFGLPYNEALKSITIYPAQLLGINKSTGSLKVGKDATFIISSGDVLDMRSSNIEHAYSQGKKVDLTNPQEELYKKFKKIVLEK